MIDAGGHVLFFALTAAASPLTLTATLIVLGSSCGRGTRRRGRRLATSWL